MAGRRRPGVRFVRIMFPSPTGVDICCRGGRCPGLAKTITLIVAAQGKAISQTMDPGLRELLAQVPAGLGVYLRCFPAMDATAVGTS